MFVKDLAVHQIELVVNTRENFGDGRAVGDHAAGTHDLGQITTRHHRGRLVVDAALEASGAPVHKLDGALGFDGGNGRIHVLRYNITAVPAAGETQGGTAACKTSKQSITLNHTELQTCTP